MAKVELKPNTVLMPVPVILATAVDKNGKANIITLAWVGTVASTPPHVSVSIRPSRFSYDLVKENKEFAINIPSQDLLLKTDGCGVVSGRDVDKFEKFDLTAVESTKIKSPIIKECPVNMECKVVHSISLGSHDMFVGEVVALHADEEVLTGGKIDTEKVMPIAYVPHEYWGLKEKIGTYGFSQKLT